MPGKFTFYSRNIENGTIILDEFESKHAVQVLRFKVGDNIEVTDGLGNMYAANIQAVEKKYLKAEIIGHQSFDSSRVHIVVGILKNSDRMEWLVEKCTELGCASIGFLETQNSERSKINLDRLKKTAISAMKQSHSAWIPNIELLQWNQVLSSNIDLKFIAYCDSKNGVSVKTQPHALTGKLGEVLICIGPEGDFSSYEFEKALNQRFDALNLGDHILRAETAAIAACAWANWA